MTKAIKELKGNCLKVAEKKTDKSRKVLQREGGFASKRTHKSCKEKSRKFFGRKEQFCYKPRKAESCHNTKATSLTKGGCSF